MQRYWSNKKKAVIWMAVVSLAFTAVAFMSVPETPVAYLTKGEAALRLNQYEIAIENFEAALGISGRFSMNATGRAMAYWNLHYCYIRLDNIDKAAESLLGFIVYGLDYMDFIEGLSESERRNHPGTSWLKQFKVKKKLDFAAKRIYAYWKFKQNGK